jgi:hypothetical protein
MPPGDGHIAYSANPGIWQNTWNKARTDELIREEGFGIQVHEFDAAVHGAEYAAGNSLYVMRRR